MHRLHFSVMQSYDVSPRRKALNKDRDEDTGEDINESLALMSQRVPRGNAMGNVSRPQSALLRAPRAIFLWALYYYYYYYWGFCVNY